MYVSCFRAGRPLLTSVAYLQWLEAELAELQACPAASVRVHITGKDSAEQSPWSSPALTLVNDDDEKHTSHTKASLPGVLHSAESTLSNMLRDGRPDIEALVVQAVATTQSNKRVLIAAAGPGGMLTDTRVAATARIESGLPSVHFHMETYGW